MPPWLVPCEAHNCIIANYLPLRQIGQVPFLDQLLFKNPLLLWCSKYKLLKTRSSPAVAFAQERMNDPARLEIEADASRRDFLSRFKEAQNKSPELITPRQVIGLTAGNVFAGSDTTACTLRAVFYLLLRNPEKMGKLLHELDQLEQTNDSESVPLVTWSEVRDLPYLGAVIKEALRCFPAVGLPLERIVPAAGMTVCGYFLPCETIVGCNAWALHQNQDIFGDDSDIFRPERWLDRPKDKIGAMNTYLLAFGAGSRSCIGKNISLLEIYKLVPTLLRTFEVGSALERK
jgi:cytochrome P450